MFTIRKYNTKTALRGAATNILTRSDSKLAIVTREPEEVRKLFTAEELKRISFIAPEEYAP